MSAPRNVVRSVQQPWDRVWPRKSPKVVENAGQGETWHDLQRAAWGVTREPLGRSAGKSRQLHRFEGEKPFKINVLARAAHERQGPNGPVAKSGPKVRTPGSSCEGGRLSPIGLYALENCSGSPESRGGSPEHRGRFCPLYVYSSPLYDAKASRTRSGTDRFRGFGQGHG